MRNSLLITILVLTSTSFSLGCASAGDAGDGYSDAESNASAPGKLALWKSSDAQWRFHVISGNGRTLLTSEGYTTRTGALGGALSVLDNGVDAARYEVHATASGFNLRLRAGNHEIIASSESYASKSNATRAIGACLRALSSYLDEVDETPGARVALTGDAASGYYFDIYDGSGELALSSEAYATAEGAWNGAFASQDAASREAAFAVVATGDGDYYLTLTANNGALLAASRRYLTEADAQGDIRSMRTLLASIRLI